ncbi:MAG: Spore protein SP21 [Verrucomicrobiae bacterium]|nr:Spore protein SP21 [Verrucomicrobiae bacterium]
MALIRWRPTTDLWDPFAGLDEMRKEVNRAFETAFAPALDVVEAKDDFLVKVDLPGLNKEDVSVTIQDNFLTIKGERKHEAEKKETNFYHRERVHGVFSRTIELPTRVEASKVSANFRDGVLHVTLPKSEEAKPKEIKVSVN